MFVTYFELPEEPVVIDYWERKDRETGDIIKIPKLKLTKLRYSIG